MQHYFVTEATCIYELTLIMYFGHFFQISGFNFWGFLLKNDDSIDNFCYYFIVPFIFVLTRNWQCYICLDR
jgi:hypothetical protein